jgi:hypothetical protein
LEPDSGVKLLQQNTHLLLLGSMHGKPSFQRQLKKCKGIAIRTGPVGSVRNARGEKVPGQARGSLPAFP